MHTATLCITMFPTISTIHIIFIPIVVVAVVAVVVAVVVHIFIAVVVITHLFLGQRIYIKNGFSTAFPERITNATFTSPRFRV
jgi:hypothetical protein